MEMPVLPILKPQDENSFSVSLASALDLFWTPIDTNEALDLFWNQSIRKSCALGMDLKDEAGKGKI